MQLQLQAHNLAKCHGWRMILSKWRKFGVNSASSKGDNGWWKWTLSSRGYWFSRRNECPAGQEEKKCWKGIHSRKRTKRGQNRIQSLWLLRPLQQVRLNRQENLGKEQMQRMAARHLLFAGVILRRKIPGPMIHSTYQTLHPGHRAMPAESRRSARTGTEEAGQFRWNEKRIQSKEKLIDAIKPEGSKSNAA